MTTPEERADLNEKSESESEVEQSAGQVSEAGGALNDGETALAGADAIPDKTTGTAGDNRANS